VGKVIAKGVVSRKPGFLYYVDGKGNSFYLFKMNHRRLRGKNGEGRQEKEEKMNLFYN